MISFHKIFLLCCIGIYSIFPTANAQTSNNELDSLINISLYEYSLQWKSYFDHHPTIKDNFRKLYLNTDSYPPQFVFDLKVTQLIPNTVSLSDPSRSLSRRKLMYGLSAITLVDLNLSGNHVTIAYNHVHVYKKGGRLHIGIGEEYVKFNYEYSCEDHRWHLKDKEGKWMNT